MLVIPLACISVLIHWSSLHSAGESLKTSEALEGGEAAAPAGATNASFQKGALLVRGVTAAVNSRRRLESAYGPVSLQLLLHLLSWVADL